MAISPGNVIDFFSVNIFFPLHPVIPDMFPAVPELCFLLPGLGNAYYQNKDARCPEKDLSNPAIAEMQEAVDRQTGHTEVKRCADKGKQGPVYGHISPFNGQLLPQDQVFVDSFFSFVHMQYFLQYNPGCIQSPEGNHFFKVQHILKWASNPADAVSAATVRMAADMPSRSANKPASKAPATYPRSLQNLKILRLSALCAG